MAVVYNATTNPPSAISIPVPPIQLLAVSIAPATLTELGPAVPLATVPFPPGRPVVIAVPLGYTAGGLWTTRALDVEDEGYSGVERVGSSLRL
jgi:hypothetical protein